MIKTIHYFFWRIRLGIEFSIIVTDGNFIDGFKYSSCLKDLFKEGFDAREALKADMEYWDG